MTDESREGIIFASDHGGVALKDSLVQFSSELGYHPLDLGVQAQDSEDYPDIVLKAVEVFKAESVPFMVLICGSGVGVCMAANRFACIRAVSTDNPYLARLARQHNHANCLCMGERTIGTDLAREVLAVFLKTQEDLSQRHGRRVKKLGQL